MKLRGDVGDEEFCRHAVSQVVDRFGRLDVLVNNAAEQHPQPTLEDITAEPLARNFRTNIFGYFYLTKAALPPPGAGAYILTSTSVTAHKGNTPLPHHTPTPAPTDASPHTPKQ